MKENIRFIIIGLAIIFAATIHSCGQRYHYIAGAHVFDNWTGQIHEVYVKK